MTYMLTVYPGKDALVQAAVEHITAVGRAAVDDHGYFALALAGGSTPKPVYAALEPGALDWSKVLVFWGDERCVPPDHADSNYRMARESLLDRLPIPAGNVYRVHGELEPTMAAHAYSEVLRVVLQRVVGTLPRFDLLLLGLGDDAHTASLFPYTPPIRESQRWVTAHYVGKLDAWRVTLTPVLLNAAHQVTFIAAGESKAEALQRVLYGPHQPDMVPAQAVQPLDGGLSWLVDAAAARLIYPQQDE